MWSPELLYITLVEIANGDRLLTCDEGSEAELDVNPAKCSLLYFHNTTHPLTAAQSQLLHTIGLQWDVSDCDAAELLGAVIGIDTAAIARRLDRKFHGANGLFAVFFRRVRSGGFSVQAAMTLPARSISRLAYLQRCLPPEALLRVAKEWNRLLISAATHVLDVAADEATGPVIAALQRPRRLGGFGLLSTVFISPFAFIASVAASAAQSGNHPLSVDALPVTSLLHQWLDAALTCPAVDDIRQEGAVPSMHYSATTFTAHFHAQPEQAAHLQSKLTYVATNTLFNARVNEVTEAGDLRELTRLHGGRAKYASRWKTAVPTEKAYELADEYYRYAVRRDLGLAPTQDRILPRRCGACGMGIASDGLHGQRCIHNSSYIKLRHDSIEHVIHNTIRDGIGHSYRQQHGLPAAECTIPDLTITLVNQSFLCDVTVVDTLATSNLAVASRGPGKCAAEAAARKIAKYSATATAMRAVHLPFAIETMGGMSESAQQLIQAIHHIAAGAGNRRGGTEMERRYMEQRQHRTAVARCNSGRGAEGERHVYADRIHPTSPLT